MSKRNRQDTAAVKQAKARSALTTLMIVLAGGALVPTAGEAQNPERRGGGGMRGEMAGSVAFLLEKAEDLSLSAEQKVSLDVLANEVREANAPLREQMQSLRGGGDREGMRELMTSMREGDQASVEKAMALLDEGQRESAKTLLEERRSQRRRPPG